MEDNPTGKNETKKKIGKGGGSKEGLFCRVAKQLV
jgi:hypothetical protein